MRDWHGLSAWLCVLGLAWAALRQPGVFKVLEFVRASYSPAFFRDENGLVDLNTWFPLGVLRIVSENWSKTAGSKVRSLRADAVEWRQWEDAAAASGKTLNAWIRGWLNEALRFERVATLFDDERPAA